MEFDLSLLLQVSDISHHQGYPPRFPVVDFRKMKYWGFLGCIHRASHGKDHDNAFVYNWPACRLVMPCSSYHFYENWIEPKRQAEKYWTVIEKDPAGMMWLDLEDRSIGDYYHWDYWYQWIERLKQISGYDDEDIGIYSSRSYILENFKTASAATKLYFKDHKFWFADYGPRGSDPLRADFSIKRTPFPYEDSDVLLVQTGTPTVGLAAGVYSNEIDYNRVNGYRAFNKIFGLNPSQGSLHIDIRRI